MDRNITLREGLKGKTFLEKIDYLWTYYKIHIIAIVSILFLLFIFISDLLRRQSPYCNIKYIDNNISNQELTVAADKLNDIVLKNNKDYVINFDSQFDMMQISNRQVDIAIVSKEFFEENFKYDMFLNLDTLNGGSDLPLEKYGVIKKLDSSGKEGIYGIEAKDLNILKDINSERDDGILVVISNTDHNENVVNVLKVFLK